MMRPSRVARFALGSAMCFGIFGGVFSEDFLQCTGQKQNLPTAPGTADYVLVRVENAAELPPGTGVGWLLQWRIAGGLPGGVGVGGGGMALGEDIGDLVDCNITVVTAGSLDDPTAPGAWIIYNPALDPVGQPLQPLGEILQNGVHFRCGDTVSFVTVKDETIPEGYKIVWVVHSGQDQTGPFSGPNAFALYEREVGNFETQFAPYLP